ncbi:MAG: hypothetical protein QM666_11495 [Acinetobacter sp.]
MLSSISERLRWAYEKAEGFIDEEREVSVSQQFFNATLQRFVTDNVALLKDLHADLHDDWLRLYATVKIAGLYAELSVDLKLLFMEINDKKQLLIFEQIDQTQVIRSSFNNIFKKWAVHGALFFYQKILNRDPLGIILQRFDVVQVKDDLLHLDLNRWLGSNPSIISTLAKIQVNHAELVENNLIIYGNVNLAAVLQQMPNKDLSTSIPSNQ